MIKTQLAIPAMLLLAASLPFSVQAAGFGFSFSGPGVSGIIELTYGAATDPKYPQAYEVTGISGFFSDSNNGLNIVNAPVGPLLAVTRDTPESTNLLAPNGFSRFGVAAGLPAQNNGFLTYDNLFWPGGSPQTASDFPFQGGFLDIYGLMFGIGGGRVVNLWSNGNFSGGGPGPVNYGVAVATQDTALDYVGGGVSATPEPGALALFGGGLVAMLLLRRFSGRGTLETGLRAGWPRL